jgi:hypothetical protein
MTANKTRRRKPLRTRTQSAALRRLIDDLTAERYRPVPRPAPVHDAAHARERLAEALGPARRTRRGRA